MVRSAARLGEAPGDEHPLVGLDHHPRDPAGVEGRVHEVRVEATVRAQEGHAVVGLPVDGVEAAADDDAPVVGHVEVGDGP